MSICPDTILLPTSSFILVDQEAWEFSFLLSACSARSTPCLSFHLFNVNLFRNFFSDLVPTCFLSVSGARVLVINVIVRFLCTFSLICFPPSCYIPVDVLVLFGPTWQSPLSLLIKLHAYHMIFIYMGSIWKMEITFANNFLVSPLCLHYDIVLQTYVFIK